MKPAKWNTGRIALIGAGVGAMVTAAQIEWPWYGEFAAANIGQILGGAAGGALLFALVSGMRNLFVR